ncbi:MarR family transcriptional regulator [Microbacterium sp. NIBRBAC000506063]|uniref:MarR family transcriptional regulator n=1 Tax=Microbacterium sp. NIBRBAC000506063 TaxID=2734618 RepID=UPI001BB486EF|nr:MarR family transcriptional regulator [Microbacterium sp. NIBRBAC000506063]QTV79111.1 MarR family transcriptional regulator [Microbacterium sp. NIBRBAC000506063]
MTLPAREARSLVSGDVRRHNLQLVLDHIARTGQAARSEIAEATGLTRGSVTALVDKLLRTGLVRATEQPVSQGRGRPLVRLELAADTIALVAAQIDADRATAVVSSLAGTSSCGSHCTTDVRWARPK